MLRFDFTDSTRLRIGAACSLALHAAFVAALGGAFHRASSLPGPMPEPAPIVLNLTPPEPEPRSRQLIDRVVPGETPEDTDRIAEIAGQAMDAAIRDGDTPGPRPEIEDDFDREEVTPSPPVELPAPEEPPAPPTPAPAVQAPPAPPAPRPEQRAETPAAPAAPAEETPAPRETPRPAPDPLAERREAPPEPERPAPREPDRFDVAQSAPATPPETMPAPEPRLPQPSRGRIQDSVKREGFLAFEALQDEIAPYMREIRRRVEREWTRLLITRYNGTSPTSAIIDCAISPEGELLFAEVVGNPADPIFAGLSREALRRAGPFPPFPFEVPDLYRSNNLEIRWTFNFL